MARCDAGYFCHVCGRYVEDLTESDLYLRYVLGEVPFEDLFTAPDAHIWCRPELAQYIVDPAYEPPVRLPVPPPLRKEHRDPEWVRRREERVTRAWRRLQELPGLGVTIPEYPLPPEDPS